MDRREVIWNCGTYWPQGRSSLLSERAGMIGVLDGIGVGLVIPGASKEE